MTKFIRESMNSLDPSGKSPVDRVNCVIRGLKIVGKTSRNGRKGRRYTDDCLKSARRLYEGLKVRVNHKKKRDQFEDRPVEDTIGQLRNIRFTPDGLRGDLHYLKSHPMADRLCEAAESMPEAFGLSHDVAEWEGQIDPTGVYVVTEINKVASVDLVSDPGSTNGLFESLNPRNPVKKHKKKRKLAGWVADLEIPEVRAAFNKLLESGSVSGGTMLADSDDPMASINGAFNTCLMSVFADASMDRKAKIAKADAILEAQENLVNSGVFSPPDEPAEVEESDDDPDPDDPEKDKDKEVVESLRRENAAMKRREECRRLCESMNVNLTPVQMKALEKLDTEADRKAFLRESNTPARTTPKTGGGQRGSAVVPTNTEEFARRIKR